MDQAVSYLKLLRQSKARRNESRRGDESPVMLQGSGAEPSVDAMDLTKPDTEGARRLYGAGWESKVSFFGRVIWERPDTGFYVSEEMALHLLEENNVKNKSGANDRR